MASNFSLSDGKQVIFIKFLNNEEKSSPHTLGVGNDDLITVLCVEFEVPI